MPKVLQKNLLDEVLEQMFAKSNNPFMFKHNLNEEQRIRNSEEMALFYEEIYQKVLTENFYNGVLPIFGNVMLSTINRCNGCCSFCGANVYREYRPYVKMSESLFKKIVQELKEMGYNGRVTMQGLNEPFLDDRMIKWIPYIKRNVPNARVHIITNGTCLNTQILEQIYPYVDKLHINRYGDKGRDNIEACLNLAKSFDDCGNKIKYTPRLENEVLSQFGNNECGRYKRVSIKCTCMIPFTTLSILPNGYVNLCISDMGITYNLGNINDYSMKDIWYSDQYSCIRNKIARGRQYIDLCQTCDMFCF